MSTPPAIYGEFGQALAFAERTLTATLHEHLAQRGTTPGTWYALRLIATRGPGLAREELSHDLEGSRNVDAGTVPGLLAQLEADGLIRGDDRLDLTADGEARYRSLREYVAAPTARLLDQFELHDVETTITTLQAIAQRAAAEPARSPQ